MYETGNPEQDLRKQIEALVNEVKALTEQMKTLNDTAMGTFVQLSRLYDVTAAGLAGIGEADIVKILDMHEEGTIYSSGPVLKRFGAIEDGE